MKAIHTIILILAIWLLPECVMGQQVIVNLNQDNPDSVTVTVTVTVPKKDVPKKDATNNAATATPVVPEPQPAASVQPAANTQAANTQAANTQTAVTATVPLSADSVAPQPKVVVTELPDAIDSKSDTPTLPVAETQVKETPQQAVAQPEPVVAAENASPETHHVVMKKSLLTEPHPEMMERVIVKGDTVPLVIPVRNYGRYDRGLFNYLYLVKGSWQFGLTASYGEFNTEDVQVLSLLKNVDFKGKLYSLKPAVSYCFRSNQTMGMRIIYTRGKGDLANLAVDIDEDMNFNLHDVSYYSQSYSMGIFYRNYVGLGREKRFAVFNEVSLDFSSGSSRFKRYYNDELFDTSTLTRGASLNFSPGVCVFMHEYAAFNVSFGVFGLKFNKETQTTNGVDEGSRISSGANFKFNIFNINFGLMVVI